MSVAGGNYAVLRRISASATNDVMLAAQFGLAGLIKLVVLKRLRPQACANPLYAKTFVQQARLAAAIQHENIVRAYDVHQDEHDIYIALEYLSGEDLEYLIGQVERRALVVPVGVSCRLIAQAAEGLHQVHSAMGHDGNPLNLVHWDLQPGHVIACYTGVTKLINTGLAKADPQDAYALPGTLKHRLAYRAPERLQFGAADHRSDIYSLGVLLHELLTGRRLFPHDNEAELVKLVMEQPIPAPSEINREVPAELDRVVLSALERDPAKRLQAARELREELDRVLGRNSRSMVEDPGRWMQSALASRFAERQRTERKVSLEAMKGPSSNTSGPAELPQLFEDPMTSSVVRTATGSGIAPAGHVTATGAGKGRSGPSRILLVMLLASLATLGMVSIFGLAYYIGRGTNAPGEAEPGVVALWVQVRPLGAEVRVDGEVRSEAIDAVGLLVPAQAGQRLIVEARKMGFAPQRVSVSAPERATKEVFINLPALEGAAASRSSPEADPPMTTFAAPMAAPVAEASAPADSPASRGWLLFLLPLASLFLGGSLGGLVVRRLARARPTAPLDAAAEAEAARRIAQLGDEAAQAKAQLFATEERSRMLEEELARLKKRRRSSVDVGPMEGQLSDLRQAAEEQKEEATRSKRDADKARREADSQRQNAERNAGELTRARRDVAQLQAELSTAKDMLQQSKTKLKRAEEELTEAKRAQAKHTERMQELDRQESDSGKQLVALRQQLAVAQQQLQQATSKRETDTSQHVKLQQELLHAKAEAARLRVEYEASKVALSKAKTEASKARAELEASRVALKRAQTSDHAAVSLPGRGGDEQSELSRLRRELQLSKAELETTKAQMAALETRSSASSGEAGALGLDQTLLSAPPSHMEQASVSDAIDKDPNLSWKQRETIRLLYEGFIKKN